MNILITGGAGYIGSVTTEMLLDQGHKVVVFDNLERGHRRAVDRRALFIKGDLRKRLQIERAIGKARPEAVLHFAAYALVGESMEQPAMYFRNNVEGSLNLAEAMLDAGVPRIVFSSSCATYGQPETPAITEDTAQRPTNPYGESKLVFEKMLGWYGRLRNLQSVVLRYFNAAGASGKYGEDHDPETHLIPNVLKAALGLRPALQVFGDDYATPDGTCIRDYIHILDLARAHAASVTGSFTGAFNLGTGTGHSVRQVIEAARRVTGRPVPVDMRPRRPGDPARLVADYTKAKAALGWTPAHSAIDEIVESAWKWASAHPRGYA
ncbi:MAG: UDP-glucose 4-epimerase GalE, partial [Lentisphaerae bacterium]|nr:UDP-glucose 4-epimerase GalE [Lentisphaerota bacterium]